MLVFSKSLPTRYAYVKYPNSRYSRHLNYGKNIEFVAHMWTHANRQKTINLRHQGHEISNSYFTKGHELCTSSSGSNLPYHLVLVLKEDLCKQKCHTGKPVLSSHSKIDKAKILKTNGSLMKVESIAECSLGAFCNTFDLH